MRNYIYCDGCNPESVRNIYSNLHRKQRSSNGKAWCEGPLNEAVELGWVVSKQGYTLCPVCIQKGLSEMFRDNQLNEGELKHYYAKFSCK